MKEIIFVTGNSRKLGEAKSSCSLFDIEIKQQSLSIDEIQSHEPSIIALQKAAKAYEILTKPLVVNDAYWTIPALNGFPGGYMKDVAEWFTPEDFISLVRNKVDKSVVITECVVYQDATSVKTFKKEFRGVIGEVPKGKGNSIEQVAVFNGMTLAEHHDINQYSEKPEDQIWYEFARWFVES
jgi:XTP/dITP diphosphohydrolase